MPGKMRPSLRAKTLLNVDLSNLSLTDKECIHRVFEKFEELNTVVKCDECKYADDSCAYGLVCICEHGGMLGTIVSKRDYCSCGKRRDTE